MLPQRQSLLLQTESQRTNHFNPATITIIFTEDSSKTKESRSVTPPRGSEGFFIVLIPDALLKAHNVGENHQKHLHTNAQGEGQMQIYFCLIVLNNFFTLCWKNICIYVCENHVFRVLCEMQVLLQDRYYNILLQDIDTYALKYLVCSYGKGSN